MLTSAVKQRAREALGSLWQLAWMNGLVDVVYVLALERPEALAAIVAFRELSADLPPRHRVDALAMLLTGYVGERSPRERRASPRGSLTPRACKLRKARKVTGRREGRETRKVRETREERAMRYTVEVRDSAGEWLAAAPSAFCSEANAQAYVARELRGLLPGRVRIVAHVDVVGALALERVRTRR